MDGLGSDAFEAVMKDKFRMIKNSHNINQAATTYIYQITGAKIPLDFLHL
jgi:hypothetical protein